jgi:hypothetical protein
VDLTTWILITVTAGLLLSLLVYRIATNTVRGFQQFRRDERITERLLSGETGYPIAGQQEATDFSGGELARRARRSVFVRRIMQIFITIFGLLIGVMIIFDGCYGWLGWCPEPASSAEKNWASGMVGAVVGFWLTKA